MTLSDAHLIDFIRRNKCQPDELAARDLIALARMVRDGDLRHVDEPAPKETAR